MNTLKITIGIIAILLTFVGYVPYIRDILKKKTRPHLYSWFLWGLVSLIGFGLQFSAGGGIGSVVTLAAALVCFVIVALGFTAGKKDITKGDTVFLVGALLAASIWIFAKQPIVSVILISIIEMLGFIPTIRKSWHDPHSETLITYQMNTLRFALALFALHTYTLVTWLYPLTWLVANGLFSGVLILRRNRIGTNTSFSG